MGAPRARKTTLIYLLADASQRHRNVLPSACMMNVPPDSRHASLDTPTAMLVASESAPLRPTTRSHVGVVTLHFLTAAHPDTRANDRQHTNNLKSILILLLISLPPNIQITSPFFNSIATGC